MTLTVQEVLETQKQYLRGGYWAISKILSYNAVINIVRISRGWGKTTSPQIRALRRFLRRGKGTIWVRRTKGETAKTKRSFLSPKFCRLAGVGADDVRVCGDFAEIRRGKRWVPFVEFCTLSQASLQRSADYMPADTMIIDEAYTTRKKSAHYLGNPVSDALDLWVSKKRENPMRLVILGNRETAADPWANYFGIKIPPGFDGIMTARGGSIAYEAHEWEARENGTEFDKKVRQALNGTAYGEYLYSGAAKDMPCFAIGKHPKNAKIYCNFDFGTPLTCWTWGGKAYFEHGNNPAKYTVIRDISVKYPRGIVYTRKARPNFELLILAKLNNLLFFDSEETAEAVALLLQDLGI